MRKTSSSCECDFFELIFVVMVDGLTPYFGEEERFEIEGSDESEGSDLRSFDEGATVEDDRGCNFESL
jgi:hypothetical protein